MVQVSRSDILKGAKAAAEAAGLKPRDIYYLVETEQVPYKKVGLEVTLLPNAIVI